MTELEAIELAGIVRRNVDGVKIGHTNGKPCLHLRHGRSSTTIYSAAEWAQHPENWENRPTKRQADLAWAEGIAAAIANKEAV